MFGFVERISGKLFIQVVQNRKAETLIQIITKWISKETRLLLSDEWRAYAKLKSLGYNHMTIKHKDNFVDPNDPEVHTQNIENRWGVIKGFMKKHGRVSRISFSTRLKEIIWRIKNKNNSQRKLLEILVKQIHD